MSNQAFPSQLSGDHYKWRPLLLLNIYRLLLAVLALTLFRADIGPTPLGQVHPGLYLLCASAYLAFALIGMVVISAQRPRLSSQVAIQVMVDIIAITLMMHASGGITSGLGMLLIPAVAGAGLLSQGILAILFAAMGSLAILTQQLYTQLYEPLLSPLYTQAGMLGASLFATALVAHLLARRAGETERLAEQRGIDVANLEQLNAYIVHRMEAGVIVVDEQAQVELINPAATQLFESPLGVGDHLSGLSTELLQRLQRWREDRLEDEALLKLGPSARPIIPRFSPIGSEGRHGTLILLEDSTAIHQRAQQIKLASLGRLTASIAHEIRNPLGAISHAAQLLGESNQLDPADRRLTEIIRGHSQRVNTIIENVQMISRRSAPHPHAIELEPWLTQLIDELQSQADERARLTLICADPQCQAYFDASQLHQVLANLCENALEHSEGPVTLQVLSDPQHQAQYIEVRDNGEHLSDEVVSHLFEPFFTTRTQGSGLGLYIARELCLLNQARLDYLPMPEGGNRFRVSFEQREAL